MKLTLIRHGETDWNKIRKIQGQLDIPLNLFGVQQAHTCAKFLANQEFDAVYSSPLIRAYRTAEIICAKRDTIIKTDDCLEEINMGKWQGMVWNDIVRQYSDLVGEFERAGDLSKVYGGESFRQVQERAKDFFDYISDMPYKSVLAVSHGGFIKAAVCQVLGLNLSKRSKFNIHNLSITTFSYSRDRGWSLVSLNHYEYLDDLFSSGGSL